MGETTTAATGIDRFRVAQEQADSGFESALAELRTTGKRGHWIWYVFPQLAGLGESRFSREYGIRGAAEAAAYLRDPVLRGRLIAATEAVAAKLEAGQSLQAIMGSSIDALKLVSSLTLFEHAARTIEVEGPRAEWATLADRPARVLAQAEAQGYAHCAFTLRQLGR